MGEEEDQCTTLRFRPIHISDKYNLIYSKASLNNPYENPFDAVRWFEHDKYMKEEAEDCEKEFKKIFGTDEVYKIKDHIEKLIGEYNYEYHHIYQHIRYGFNKDIKIWEEEARYFSSDEFLNGLLEEILNKTDST